MGRGTDTKTLQEVVGADGSRYRRGRRRLAPAASLTAIDQVTAPASPTELISDVLMETRFAEQLRRYLLGQPPEMKVKARASDGRLTYGFWFQMNLHETSTLEQTWDVAKAILASDPFGGELKYETLNGVIDRVEVVRGTLGPAPYPVELDHDEGHGLVDIRLNGEMVGGLRGTVAAEWIKFVKLGYRFRAQLELERRFNTSFLQVRLIPESN